MAQAKVEITERNSYLTFYKQANELYISIADLLNAHHLEHKEKFLEIVKKCIELEPIEGRQWEEHWDYSSRIIEKLRVLSAKWPSLIYNSKEKLLETIHLLTLTARRVHEDNIWLNEVRWQTILWGDYPSLKAVIEKYPRAFKKLWQNYTFSQEGIKKTNERRPFTRQQLIEYGALVAAEKGDDHVFIFLLNLSSKSVKSIIYDAEDPYKLYREAFKGGSVPIITYLLKDLNLSAGNLAQQRLGVEFFNITARYGHVEAMKLLLDLGSKENREFIENSVVRAVSIATSSQQLLVIEFLYSRFPQLVKTTLTLPDIEDLLSNGASTIPSAVAMLQELQSAKTSQVGRLFDTRKGSDEQGSSIHEQAFKK